MLDCSIEGCRKRISEIFSPKRNLAQWIVIRPDEWPGLALTETITLCPGHRAEVFKEVLKIKSAERN